MDTLEFRIRHSRNRYVKGINYCWTFFMYRSLESERKPSLKGDIFYEVKDRATGRSVYLDEVGAKYKKDHF